MKPNKSEGALEICEPRHRTSVAQRRSHSSAYLALAASYSDEALSSAPDGLGKSSMIATTMNLITIMVGAGVLTFPALFKNVGIPVGAGMLLGCSSLSCYLCTTLSEAIGVVQGRTGTRVRKLDDLGEACFGKLGQVSSKFLVNAMFIAKIGCYMVLIGQNFEYILCPPPYRAWILVFAAILLPMAFMRDVSIIEKLAIVGVIATGVYFLTIVGGGLRAHYVSKVPGFEFSKPINILQMCSVLTVMLFGFAPTDVLATVRSEMKDPKELSASLVFSHLAVATIYLAVGAIGYWGFADMADGNITLVMRDILRSADGEIQRDSAGDIAMGGKWAYGYFLAFAVVCNLMVTIPIVLYCLFTGIEASYPKNKPMGALPNAVMRAGVVVLCASIGLFVPFFLQVISLMSAVIVVPIAVFVPVLMGYKAAADAGQPYGLERKVGSALLLLLGVLCFWIGFQDAVSDLLFEIRRNPEKSNAFNDFWAPGQQ